MENQIIESNYYSEYLTEVNNFFTKDIVSQRMYDLITPIRNYFIQDKEILSYSFCKHFGGDNKLSFFIEFITKSEEITLNLEKFKQLNTEYYKKKIPLKIKGVPNLYDILNINIDKNILPIQIKYVSKKSENKIHEISELYPELKKYLSEEYLLELDLSNYISHKSLFQENHSLPEFVKIQGKRIGFLKIGLPIIFGIKKYFSQISNLNKPNVAWSILEEILSNLSIVYQLLNSKDVFEYIYISKLNDLELYNWWQYSDLEKKNIIENNSQIKEIINTNVQKYIDISISNLDRANVGDNFEKLIVEVINWLKY